MTVNVNETNLSSAEAVAAVALDDLLDSFDASEVTIEEMDFDGIEAAEVIEDAVVVATGGALDDDLLADLDHSVSRGEIYSAQVATPMATFEEAKASTVKVKGKKAAAATKEPKAPKVAGAPRMSRDLATLPAEAFALNLDDKAASPADMEVIKAGVIAARPSQIKIAEKFDQLFLALHAGKKPSTYVMQAFAALEVKGTLTSAELIATFKANGLGQGTAHSQCGQILELFKVVGIADRVGQALTARADSTIAMALRELSADPALV